MSAVESPRAPSEGEPAPGLAIGDLAERTGVPVATLRTWESRYGAPHSTRLPSGHRRFSESEVGLVLEISRLRSSGLALPFAVDRATSARSAPERSLFRALSRHPGLHARVLRKRTLLGLTRAVEDECCARASRPLLFAGFQREQHYRQSQDRWEELARTADAAFVFADFADPVSADERPVRLSLPEPAPLRREWLVVCDSADHPACVVGVEQPGQRHVRDPERRFEVLWSVDPRIVRDAARVCAELADALQPGLTSGLAERLASTPPEASADLGRAYGILDRVVGYLDAVSTE